jgi:hypothetical protein
LGREEVVIETGGTEFETLTVNDFVTVCIGDEESETFMLKVNDPDSPGVPASLPLLLKFRPRGKVPEAILQEYGISPPEAVMKTE